MGSGAGIDLVVTDQTMPEMTGLQFVSEIRKIRESPPVVLCSGFSEQITPETLSRHRIDAFLMKPVSRRDLAETIRTILDGFAEK